MSIQRKSYIVRPLTTRALERVPCPCCGYLTQDSAESYRSCRLCHWRDDGSECQGACECGECTTESYALAEARENFWRFRVMFRPEDQDQQRWFRDFRHRYEKDKLMRLLSKLGRVGRNRCCATKLRGRRSGCGGWCAPCRGCESDQTVDSHAGLWREASRATVRTGAPAISLLLLPQGNCLEKRGVELGALVSMRTSSRRLRYAAVLDSSVTVRVEHGRHCFALQPFGYQNKRASFQVPQFGRQSKDRLRALAPGVQARTYFVAPAQRTIRSAFVPALIRENVTHSACEARTGLPADEQRRHALSTSRHRAQEPRRAAVTVARRVECNDGAHIPAFIVAVVQHDTSMFRLYV